VPCAGGGRESSWSSSRPGPGSLRGAARAGRWSQEPDPALAAAALSAGPNPLTDRERDVLRAADGRTTVADIAARLFLSESTVRNYLSSAIGKTRARNRIEAAEAARANGWLLRRCASRVTSVPHDPATRVTGGPTVGTGRTGTRTCGLTAEGFAINARCHSPRCCASHLHITSPAIMPGYGDAAKSITISQLVFLPVDLRVVDGSCLRARFLDFRWHSGLFGCG
jgi:DNA-binding CsgD family transcriptional regulator